MKMWDAEEEAARLRQRFEGVTKARFAREHNVPGGASMLSQHIMGHRPMNLAAATAYAHGFGVSLEEISPRLAAEVRQASRAKSSTRELVSESSGVPYLPGFEALSIPVLAQSGSMGSGEDQLHDEVVVGRLTVSPSWISRTIKPLTKLENLRFIHGYGDSMDPTFADGDILLVDIGVNTPKVDGVYVMEANDRIYIKRVRQRMDGSYEISSDNATVKTVDVLDGTRPVDIRGRVVWVWNGKKL